MFWLKLALNPQHLLATDVPLFSLYQSFCLSRSVVVQLLMFNHRVFNSLWLVLINRVLKYTDTLSLQILWKTAFLTDLPIHVKKQIIKRRQNRGLSCWYFQNLLNLHLLSTHLPAKTSRQQMWCQNKLCKTHVTLHTIPFPSHLNCKKRSPKQKSIFCFQTRQASLGIEEINMFLF